MKMLYRLSAVGITSSIVSAFFTTVGQSRDITPHVYEYMDIIMPSIIIVGLVGIGFFAGQEHEQDKR